MWYFLFPFPFTLDHTIDMSHASIEGSRIIAMYRAKFREKHVILTFTSITTLARHRGHWTLTGRRYRPRPTSCDPCRPMNDGNDGRKAGSSRLSKFTSQNKSRKHLSNRDLERNQIEDILNDIFFCLLFLWTGRPIRSDFTAFMFFFNKLINRLKSFNPIEFHYDISNNSKNN
jgi:hypothetical protein